MTLQLTDLDRASAPTAPSATDFDTHCTTEAERLRSIINTIVFWIADDGYIHVPLSKEKIMQAVEQAASKVEGLTRDLDALRTEYAALMDECVQYRANDLAMRAQFDKVLKERDELRAKLTKENPNGR